MPVIINNTNPTTDFSVDVTALSADQTGPAWYDDVRMAATYPQDLGLLVLPVAGPPGTPPEVVQVHGGVSLKRVDWRAVREGVPPQVPAAPLSDGVSTLLAAGATVALPALDANANMQIFSASGTYLYVMSQPVGPASGTDLNAGASPADTFTFNVNVYPGKNFLAALTPQQVPPAPALVGVTLG